jgi:hypothetical protein|nr:MAG TPA: Repressor protein CI [Caudoviricetes sp.]
MRLGEIIKKYREENNLSMDDFVKVSGLSKGYISMLEKNKNPKTGNPITPSIKTYNAVAKGMNIDIESLMKLAKGENVSLEKEENSPQQSVGIRIPVLGRVAAGIPLEAIQNIDDWEEISPQMAKSGEFFALRINGESMHPEIKNGDTVIVKKQSDIDSGDIAIVLINGNDATCKQIQKQQTGITLIGYNVGVYSPTFYTNEEIEDLPIVILGKVVEVRRKL